MVSQTAPMGFDPRQEMTKKNLELRYCLDQNLHYVELHAHPFYEIYYFLEGAVENYVVGGKSYPLLPGDILILPPGVLHQPVFYEGGRPYRRYVLWLSKEMLEMLENTDQDLLKTIRVCGERSSYRIRCTDPEVKQRLEYFLDAMWQEERTTPSCNQTYLYSLCVGFLVLLNRILEDKHALHTQQKYQADPLLEQVLAYIHENYAKPLSLHEVADLFFTSSSNIELLLRKKVGKPFYRYVTSCRMIHAQELIVSGMPLQNVGTACGYNDYSNFYRNFSQIVGVSPSQYRKHFPLDHFQSTPISQTT